MANHPRTAATPDPDDSRAEEIRRASIVGLALLRAKHDLNNLSHVARGWSRLLENSAAPSWQMQEGIDAILSAAQQTNELVNAITSLAGRPQPAAICDLPQELATLARGLRYLLAAPERLKLELPTRALVPCHFPDVQRALLDSVLALRETLGEDELQLRLHEVAPEHVESAGPELELTLERIRRVAGRELAVICCLSLRFSAQQAIVQGPPVAFTPASLEPSPLTPARVNPNTILLVDDHRDVRRLATTMLERAGYHVLTANDAEQALATSQNFDGPIQLLWCDARMRGLPSLPLIAKLRGARPELKVLVCSGERPTQELAQFARLSRPFSYEQLVHAVQACLA